MLTAVVATHRCAISALDYGDVLYVPNDQQDPGKNGLPLDVMLLHLVE